MPPARAWAPAVERLKAWALKVFALRYIKYWVVGSLAVGIAAGLALQPLRLPNWAIGLIGALCGESVGVCTTGWLLEVQALTRGKACCPSRSPRGALHRRLAVADSSVRLLYGGQRGPEALDTVLEAVCNIPAQCRACMQRELSSLCDSML